MNTSSGVLSCHTILLIFRSVNLITAQLSVQPLLVWLSKCNINEQRTLIILNCQQTIVFAPMCFNCHTVSITAAISLNCLWKFCKEKPSHQIRKTKFTQTRQHSQQQMQTWNCEMVISNDLWQICPEGSTNFSSRVTYGELRDRHTSELIAIPSFHWISTIYRSKLQTWLSLSLLRSLGSICISLTWL